MVQQALESWGVHGFSIVAPSLILSRLAPGFVPPILPLAHKCASVRLSLRLQIVVLYPHPPPSSLKGKLHLLAAVYVLSDSACSHSLSPHNLPPPLSILSPHTALWLHLRSQPVSCLSALRTHTPTRMHAHTPSSLRLVTLGPVQTWALGVEEMMLALIPFFSLLKKGKLVWERCWCNSNSFPLPASCQAPAHIRWI